MALGNWLTAREAAVLLTEQSGHRVTDAYVRRIGNPNTLHKIAIKQLDGRTRLYSRRDIERYTVKKRGDGSVRRRVRHREYEEAKEG